MEVNVMVKLKHGGVQPGCLPRKSQTWSSLSEKLHGSKQKHRHHRTKL